VTGSLWEIISLSGMGRTSGVFLSAQESIYTDYRLRASKKHGKWCC